MRRLFLAAAFSLGLLASGAALAAAPGARHAVADAGIVATPAQYRDHRDIHRPGHRVAPRPRHYHAPAYRAPAYRAPAYRAPAYWAPRHYHPRHAPRGHRYGWR